MEKNSFEKFLEDKILKGEEIAPFLFVSPDKTALLSYVNQKAESICAQYSVDKNSIYIFRNEEDKKIKIEEIKTFLAPGYQKSGFAFQVFIIEDIERMTREAANACLKFFEEPGVWNIIFLTSSSESWILDTILSRVSEVSMWGEKEERSYIFADMIEKFVEGRDITLISYFYKEVSTKDSAVLFLKEILLYLEKKLFFSPDFFEIEEDITGIKKNNLLPKYIIDKYILKLMKIRKI